MAALTWLGWMIDGCFWNRVILVCTCICILQQQDFRHIMQCAGEMENSVRKYDSQKKFNVGNWKEAADLLNSYFYSTWICFEFCVDVCINYNTHVVCVKNIYLRFRVKTPSLFSRRMVFTSNRFPLEWFLLEFSFSNTVCPNYFPRECCFYMKDMMALTFDLLAAFLLTINFGKGVTGLSTT